jgi:hypothetical protein
MSGKQETASATDPAPPATRNSRGATRATPDKRCPDSAKDSPESHPRHGLVSPFLPLVAQTRLDD